MKQKQINSKQVVTYIYILNIAVILILLIINVYFHNVNEISIKTVEGNPQVVISKKYVQLFPLISVVSYTVLIICIISTLMCLSYINKKNEKRLIEFSKHFNGEQLMKIDDSDVKNNEEKIIASAWNDVVMSIQNESEKRDKYFAEMIHDFKMPLQIIKSNIELYTLEHESDESLEMILDETKYLHKSINHFLHIERINFFERPVYSKVDIIFFINNLIDRYDFSNLKTSVRSNYDKVYVDIDEHMFIRILENLFSNIISYADNMEVDIQIDLDCIQFANYFNHHIDVENIYQTNTRHAFAKGNGIGSQIITSYINLLGWTVSSKIIDNKFITIIYYNSEKKVDYK